MSDFGDDQVTRDAGTLRLSVSYVGDVADELGGVRRLFRYRVESTDPELRETHTGEDLCSGVGAPVDVQLALGTLASYLSAAGESYRYALEHPDSEPENLGLFPFWVAEAAYLNADELALLDVEDEVSDDSAGDDRAGLARYVGVVFQQGEDAVETLTILDVHGLRAAVEHLAQWDFGPETEDAAVVYGHVYDEPPAGVGDHAYFSGEYVMTYSHAYGHVGLVRRLDPPPDNPPRAEVSTSPKTRQHGLRRGDVAGGLGSGDVSPWTRPVTSPRRGNGPARPSHGI